MRNIINDERYRYLKTLAERKKVFADYVEEQKWGAVVRNALFSFLSIAMFRRSHTLFLSPLVLSAFICTRLTQARV